MANLGGLIAIAIALVIGGVFIYGGVTSMATASQMQSWPTVNGTIVSSNVTSHVVYNHNSNTGYSSQTIEYSPFVEYSYTVNGQTLTGDSIGLFGFSSSSRSQAQQEAAKYPVGSQTPVYYNPSKPSQAFLERAASGWLNGGLLFLIVGIVVLVIGIALGLRQLLGGGRVP